jgi:hypothetical protein
VNACHYSEASKVDFREYSWDSILQDKRTPTQNLNQQTVQGICFSAKNGHLKTQTTCCKETVEVARVHAPASSAIDPNKSLGVASVFKPGGNRKMVPGVKIRT